MMQGTGDEPPDREIRTDPAGDMVRDAAALRRGWGAVARAFDGVRAGAPPEHAPRARPATGARGPAPDGAIDLHTHVLPGVDDGAATLDDALALARMAYERGTRTLVATPHVNARYATPIDEIAGRTDALQQALDAAGIPVTVLSGAEVALGRVADLTASELDTVRLGGGPYVLLECPFAEDAATDLAAGVRLLGEQGLQVVLGHPERSPHVQRDPALLARLVEGGALTSVTASTFTGRFGSAPRRFAVTLLTQGLVHDVASDAHDIAKRPPGLEDGLAAAGREVRGIERLHDYLSRDVAAAVLEGRPSPPAPERPAAKRSLRRAVLGG